MVQFTITMLMQFFNLLQLTQPKMVSQMFVFAVEKGKILLSSNLSLTAGATGQICSVAHVGFAGTAAVAQHFPAPGPMSWTFGPTSSN